MSERQHFYSVCFMGTNGFPKQSVLASPHKCVTAPDILKCLHELKLPTNCPMISASYLGHMTQEEFESGELPE